MSEVVSTFPAQPPAGGEPLAGVALVTIDRAPVLNALDAATMIELVATMERLDADEDCRVIVITGAGERAFAAGADIKEMAGFDARAARENGHFARWDAIAEVATPIVAAVRGFILGGGLELAMACDIIIAADDATFGQPEVQLGIMPGVGGTQRLTRAIGKARAMELILSGRRFSAAEAAAFGLVSRLEPAERVLPASLELAAEIASQAPLAVRAAKVAIDLAAETTLAEGVAAEREAFSALFDTEDQDEGMRAFIEKRPPAWKGR